MYDAQHEQIVAVLVHQPEVDLGHELRIRDGFSDELQFPALGRLHQGGISLGILGV